MSWIDKFFKSRGQEASEKVDVKNTEQFEFVKFLVKNTHDNSVIQHHIVFDQTDQDVAKFVSSFQPNPILDPRFSPKNSSKIYYGYSVELAIHMIIGKKHLKSKNITFVSSIIDQIIESVHATSRINCLSGILINGYDSDPRPLWEISEAKAWYTDLDKKYPFLPFLLHPVDVPIYAGMIASAKKISGSHSAIDPLSMTNFISTVFSEGNKFCNRMSNGDSTAEKRMIDEATNRINKSIFSGLI